MSTWILPIDECPGDVLVNVHMTFAIAESPVSELPATQFVVKDSLDRESNFLQNLLFIFTELGYFRKECSIWTQERIGKTVSD
jgi:hypothetical protein